MKNVSFDVVHFYLIRVRKKDRQIIDWLRWDDLRWDLRTKYDWYFKYRAALLQVKYPKCEIECQWGHYPAEGKTKEYLTRIKISSKKAQLTKWKNILDEVRNGWDELFPIEENERYQKALNKVKALEFEMNSITNNT